jgi:adenosine deaminase
MLALLSLLLGVASAKVDPAFGHRIELHVHLDGSISPQTLLDVSQARNLSLPLVGYPKTVSDIQRLLSSKQPFERFDVINDIVGGDSKALEHVAEQFVAFQVANGVIYTEVRYDPVRMARSAYTPKNKTMSPSDAVTSIQAGLQRGMAGTPTKEPVTLHQVHAVASKPYMFSLIFSSSSSVLPFPLPYPRLFPFPSSYIVHLRSTP